MNGQPERDKTPCWRAEIATESGFVRLNSPENEIGGTLAQNS
jgi:hypothetical protein